MRVDKFVLLDRGKESVGGGDQEVLYSSGFGIKESAKHFLGRIC